MITEGQPGSCDLIAPFVHIQVQGATDGTPKSFRGGGATRVGSELAKF
jgi:hypothetical protein